MTARRRVLPKITSKLIRECYEWRSRRFATVREWCESKGYDTQEFKDAVSKFEDREIEKARKKV